MNITFNTKEFNEAITLYLDSLGFSVDKFDISTRIVAGRSGNETRAEITLEPKKINTELTKNNITLSGSCIKEDKPPFETDKQTIGDIFNKGDKWWEMN